MSFFMEIVVKHDLQVYTMKLKEIFSNRKHNKGNKTIKILNVDQLEEKGFFGRLSKSYNPEEVQQVKNRLLTQK